MSPDLKVSCQCCRTGLCEIKCPYSVRSEIPKAENLKYLTKTTDDDGNETTKLSKTHEYYYQIQGQLAVTMNDFCDLFVYTWHGYHLERIYIEPEFYKTLFEPLVWFWESYVSVELLYHGIKNKTEGETSANDGNQLVHVKNYQDNTDDNIDLNIEYSRPIDVRYCIICKCINKFTVCEDCQILEIPIEKENA